MALTINPVSSFFFPYVQPAFAGNAASSTAAAASTTSSSATTAAPTAAQSAAAAFQRALASGGSDPAASATSSLLSQTFGSSSFLNQAAAYGTSNLAGMALLRTMFGNGASSSVFGYPSGVTAFSSFLQQVQASYVSRYNAFGLLDAVQSLGTLINVSG